MSSPIEALTKAPWWSREAVGQMGPAIVVLFILLSVVVYSYLGPIMNLAQNFSDSANRDAQILEAVQLGNHYQWADCVNGAKDDPVALARCVPPPSKRINDEQAYMLDMPEKTRIMTFVQPAHAAIESFSGSTTGSGRITPRDAEARAAEQEERRMWSLRRQGLDLPPSE